MTKHEQRLAAIILGQIGDLPPEKAVERLFEAGLVNRRACEQLAMRAEIERLERTGITRGRAMIATAELLCCSYEKVRDSYYNVFNKRRMKSNAYKHNQ